MNRITQIVSVSASPPKKSMPVYLPNIFAPIRPHYKISSRLSNNHPLHRKHTFSVHPGHHYFRLARTIRFCYDQFRIKHQFLSSRIKLLQPEMTGEHFLFSVKSVICDQFVNGLFSSFAKHCMVGNTRRQNRTSRQAGKYCFLLCWGASPYALT